MLKLGRVRLLSSNFPHLYAASRTLCEKKTPEPVKEVSEKPREQHPFRQAIDENDKNFRDRLITKNEHPLLRTGKILKNDMKILKSWFVSPKDDESPVDYIDKYRQENFQSHCDVLVIGGGGIGSSIAYWLKKRAREGLNVVVVERDHTYANSSTCLSVGGLRQQFSVVENIQMSLYGAEFLRGIKEHLGEEVDVNFTPHGYLMLATEEGAAQLEENSKLQNVLGAKNELLTATKLKRKFPWLNTDGIVLGCHGLEKEGWFDPYALLCGLRKKAIEYGAHYVEAEAMGFDFQSMRDVYVEGSNEGIYEKPEKLFVKMKDGEIRTIKFAYCVIAAGAHSAEVARMARIGTGPGMLSVPLPVEPRKRFVYVYNCENNMGPGLNTPLVVDPTGTYFRRDGLGGNYLAGRSPPRDREPSIDNFDVDYSYFDTDVWPSLAKRVPSFEAIKVKSAWAGYYDYNTFDENGIIGIHPYYFNMFMATGFSGHGIQQVPAVGRAMAEIIIDGAYRTIDLSRLAFDRLIVDQPMFEQNIV